MQRCQTGPRAIFGPQCLYLAHEANTKLPLERPAHRYYTAHVALIHKSQNAQLVFSQKTDYFPFLGYIDLCRGFF